MRRARLALALVVLLVACGGATEEQGRAELWVTRDRGAEVLLQRTVPAGLTVLQALRREADVETRYGGRFVQAINGLEGSLSGGRDWFFFVNGVAADRGAAEYRLRAGETVWWDYRAWEGDKEVAVVVGAFPEPFLHGYDGRRRPAAVRYELPTQARAARAIARLIGAKSVASARTPVPAGANAFVIRAGPPQFTARLSTPEGPYRFTFAGDALRLARNPGLVRFRYQGLP
jgi:Domain of unknown function (DUF4430)